MWLWQQHQIRVFVGSKLTSLNIGHGAKPKLRLDVDVEAGRGTKDILNIIEKGQI